MTSYYYELNVFDGDYDTARAAIVALHQGSVKWVYSSRYSNDRSRELIGINRNSAPTAVVSTALIGTYTDPAQTPVRSGTTFDARSRPFFAPSVRFNGTNTSLQFAGLTGLTDTKEFTASMWIKRFSTGTTETVFRGREPGARNACVLGFDATNRALISGTNALGANILTGQGGSLTPASGWVNLLMSARMTLGTTCYSCYANDSLMFSSFGGVNLNDTFDYIANFNPFRIGSLAGTSQFLNAEVAEFFWHNSYIDVTQQSNRRKFISASLKPVSLGVTGELPLGVRPLIYLRGSRHRVLTNLGSAGNPTAAGTLVSGASSPSS